jgi:hypothetical protein
MPELFRELSDQFKDSGFRKIPEDSLKKSVASSTLWSSTSNFLRISPEFFIAVIHACMHAGGGGGRVCSEIIIAEMYLRRGNFPKAVIKGAAAAYA